MINRKKILIASAAFFPENSPRSFRATELAKEFVRQGHDTTVLTLDGGELLEQFCIKHSINLKKLSPRVFKYITLRGNFVKKNLLRILNRIALHFIEYPDIELMFKYKNALKNERGYDMLVSIAMPHTVHWGAAWAQKVKGQIAKVWVADCGDPYMGNKADSFKRPFYFKYFEKWFCRKADYIAITNIHMKDNYYPEFHDKIIEITQGFNFDEGSKLLRPYVPNSKPTFAYAGTFIAGSRDPRALLNYLVESELDFKFYIFSTQRSLIEPYLANSNGCIELMEPVSRKQLLPILGSMDFLVNISYDVKIQSPSKLVDYYLVNRPVLSLPSNYIDKELIQEFLNGNYQGQFNFEGYEKFRIESVCSLFLSLINRKRITS